ncbi:hypothetical protein NDI56_18385 [Haloarcula sp. S1CR25-12]|uniref:Uncharacterized protein n=1 Tax=Haloarcula saliterrae TaxID=2950534 RepID=A0ABU2FGI8_9EURY|nr:hypothetical protein [Haloarcula sp. S1CR25-12]MDS0261373.1 hypothetical protein [Haloarcula sp. S1CR25-12]
MSTQNAGSPLGNLAILSTVVDAALAFLRGDRWAAAILLGAAALSTRVTGAGVVASLLVRILRRLR